MRVPTNTERKMKGIFVRGIVPLLSLALATGLAAQTTAPSQSVGDQSRTYDYKAANESARPYRLFVPTNWKPGKKLPVIVVLHGGAQDQNGPLDGGPAGFEKILQREAEARGYIVVSPQGQNGKLGVAGAYGAIFKMPQRPAGAPPQPPRAGMGEPLARPAPPPGMVMPQRQPVSPEESARLNKISEQDVLNVLEMTIKEYGADRSRVFIMGNSLGEIGTLHLVQAYPQLWCALAPSGGPIDISTYPFDRVKALKGARPGRARLQRNRASANDCRWFPQRRRRHQLCRRSRRNPRRRLVQSR
jgi:poly(3-hydroxybutyrate) depolymerase